jgi:GTPase SAR1 family protein
MSFSQPASYRSQNSEKCLDLFRSRNPKLVVIGDGAVGKTCLLVVYANGSFPTEAVDVAMCNKFSLVSFHYYYFSQKRLTKER